jgi:regulator of RNase E activity RraA
MRAVGRVLPSRHHGSVDVFLEALETARGGEVLVIDNGGRTDEACIGDLVVIEAREAGLAGMVVWGCHRDDTQVVALGLPVFSYGTIPVGPRAATPRGPEALRSARVGAFEVTAQDFVLADGDGAVFAPIDRAEELLEVGRSILRVESEQAERVEAGTMLREQMRFSDYLAERARESSYTFREHLRRLGAEVEE